MTNSPAERIGAFVPSVTFPARYDTDLRAPFRTALEAHLTAGISVLDIGSGRNPAVALQDRPRSVHYAGLDPSAEELDAAGAGAYDETIVAHAEALQDHLIGRFDLIVSWQVLEHVEDLGAAVVCMRAYLKPGGTLIAMFSGSRSAFAIANRLLPSRLGASIATRVGRRSATVNPVFPAFYDRCNASALRNLFADWDDTRLTPLYAGAGYFRFSVVAIKTYLAVENFLERRGAEDFATHYLLVARR